MLNSLLNRPHRQIRIDRIVKYTEEESELVQEPDEVLKEVRKHFEKQFRKRNITQYEALTPRWRNQYTP